MTLSSKTQKVLTSNLLLIPTVIIAVSVAWFVSKIVKENKG